MTLGEHIDELRTRLMRSVIAVAVVFMVAWAFHERLADWAMWPYDRAQTWLNIELVESFNAYVEEDPDSWPEYFTSADPETREVRFERKVPALMKGDASSMGFFFLMRVCFWFSLFFAGPIVLWQMWQFVAAGLYKSEKSLAYSYFPFSLLLFLGGALFGYFLMVPYALFFLARMTIEQIQYWESIDNYWSFLISLTLALGAVFQLPVVMLALARLELVEPKTYSKFRPHCIVAALVLAALLTPPDPFTQLMMAVPIILLYEIGNQFARIGVKRARAREVTKV